VVARAFMSSRSDPPGGTRRRGRSRPPPARAWLDAYIARYITAGGTPIDRSPHAPFPFSLFIASLLTLLGRSAIRHSQHLIIDATGRQVEVPDTRGAPYSPAGTAQRQLSSMRSPPEKDAGLGRHGPPDGIDRGYTSPRPYCEAAASSGALNQAGPEEVDGRCAAGGWTRS